MSRARNDQDWDELHSQYEVFTDADDPRHESVWRWAEQLRQGGRMTSRDVYALNCLIGALLKEPKP